MRKPKLTDTRDSIHEDAYSQEMRYHGEIHAHQSIYSDVIPNLALLSRDVLMQVACGKTQIHTISDPPVPSVQLPDYSDVISNSPRNVHDNDEVCVPQMM